MATTVTYKGETLTSFSNTTKTMLTAGKYMEDDVTIVSSEGVGIPFGVANTDYTFTDLSLAWNNSAEEDI